MAPDDVADVAPDLLAVTLRAAVGADGVDGDLPVDVAKGDADRVLDLTRDVTAAQALYLVP